MGIQRYQHLLQLSPQDSEQGEQAKPSLSQAFPKQVPSTDFESCCLRVRFIIQHTSMVGCNPPQRLGKLAHMSLPFPCSLLQISCIPQEGACTHVCAPALSLLSEAWVPRWPGSDSQGASLRESHLTLTWPCQTKKEFLTGYPLELSTEGRDKNAHFPVFP